MRRVLAAVLLLSVFVVHGAWADTTWVNAGNVSGIWTADHSPYMMRGTITVPAGQRLDIGPGVRITWWSNRARLLVVGRISAIGSIADSIYFGSPESFPSDGITLSGTADSAVFAYCSFRFTESGMTANGPYVQLRHSALRGVAGNYALTVSGTGRVLDMADCVVEHNRAAMYSAGLMLEGTQASLTNCLIRDNGYGTYGSGLRIRQNSRVTMDGCLIAGNTGEKGGGISVSGHSTLIMNHCVVSGDSSLLGMGGGILMLAADTLRMSHCIVAGNVSGGSIAYATYGGGILAASQLVGDPYGYLELDHCILADNIATNPGNAGPCAGGALWGGSRVILDHCTVTGNSATDGSALAYAANVTLHNSIIADNPGVQAPNAEIHASLQAVRYSDFHAVGHRLFSGPAVPGFQILSQTNANGDTCDQFFNLFRDPLWVDTAAGNYQLTAASPCIDAGDPQSARDPDGTVADMGAFPYFQPSSVDPSTAAEPESFALNAFPNPFNATVVLSFDVKRTDNVSLVIYDLLGREAATLASGSLPPGSYRRIWQADDQASGTYIAVLRSGSQTQLRKLVLIK
jgi:hypothetical protein